LVSRHFYNIPAYSGTINFIPLSHTAVSRHSGQSGRECKTIFCALIDTCALIQTTPAEYFVRFSAKHSNLYQIEFQESCSCAHSRASNSTTKKPLAFRAIKMGTLPSARNL
jgi:hypothetical protein